MLDRFPDEVATQLEWYVYRLIDPRNGETFYVGKGRFNRVFDHVKRALSKEEDSIDLKYRRIQDIDETGLKVLHLIHRHGIKDSVTAYEVEAALMEAYPGLTNKVAGHGSGEFGCRHASQIVDYYRAEPFKAQEPLILISINKSYDEEGMDIYKAVRGVWRINMARAKKYKLVLAHRRGLVVGAYRPSRWLDARISNFPWLEYDFPKRIGFEGKTAEPDVVEYYLRKRVPDTLRLRGAANPVRFVEIAQPL